MDVCMYVAIACTCLCTCGRKMLTSNVFITLTFVFWDRVFLWTWGLLAGYACWPESPWILPVSSSQHWGCKYLLLCPDFYMGAGLEIKSLCFWDKPLTDSVNHLVHGGYIYLYFTYQCVCAQMCSGTSVRFCVKEERKRREGGRERICGGLKLTLNVFLYHWLSRFFCKLGACCFLVLSAMSREKSP